MVSLHRLDVFMPTKRHTNLFASKPMGPPDRLARSAPTFRRLLQVRLSSRMHATQERGKLWRERADALLISDMMPENA